MLWHELPGGNNARGLRGPRWTEWPMNGHALLCRSLTARMGGPSTRSAGSSSRPSSEQKVGSSSFPPFFWASHLIAELLPSAIELLLAA